MMIQARLSPPVRAMGSACAPSSPHNATVIANEIISRTRPGTASSENTGSSINTAPTRANRTRKAVASTGTASMPVMGG